MTEAAIKNDPENDATRKVGAALGIGIFVLPLIFAWFLLRKGYGNSARLIAFGWMLATFVIVIFSAGNSDHGTTSTAAPSVASVDAAPDKSDKSDNLTGPQRNAARSAEQYLRMSGFSRDGLIAQLSSPAGDRYEVADATAAVDSLNVDWNENAVKSAKQYLSMSGFSCEGLIQQLSSSAGDKYTVSQATYGARKAGACS
jgi:hypothetical protein